MRKLIIVLLCVGVRLAQAQIVNTGVMDTTDFRYQGKITFEGYLDTYYAYDFNKPVAGDRPYASSMSRHNEMTINLAFIDLKYSSSRLRARIVPGFGTYINANYAHEPGVLKNIVEASAGIKVFKSKSVWCDFGVLGSPYTNESAISKDHLAYTRSFAPEFVPYYLSGVKLSAALSRKVNAYLYLVNGWQQITDANSGKSVGTQLEYRPNNQWLLNWNTYAGSERSATDPEYSTRYFTDFFFIYGKGKWSATGCAYLGLQLRDSANRASWWQANLLARYQVTDKLSVTVRGEFFNDPAEVVVKSTTSSQGFSCYSSSVGLNARPAENILFRLEYRTFFSEKNVFTRNASEVKESNLLTTNVTIWF